MLLAKRDVVFFLIVSHDKGCVLSSVPPEAGAAAGRQLTLVNKKVT